MIFENKFKTSKTTRYYFLGNLNNQIGKIWFVFHGYGQLAKEFIKDFEIIANNQTLIIAPEAMNKFYTQGFTGKIGATWMTKEDRENEIEDYVNMIDQVYKQISDKIDLTQIQINVLGFSQGGHTAVRWLNKKNIHIKNLCLWGSGFPRDIDYQGNLNYWNKVKVKLIIGESDRFITKEKLNEEVSFLQSQNVNYDLIAYEGDHLINEYILSKIDKLL
jgi:predicted esterase